MFLRIAISRGQYWYVSLYPWRAVVGIILQKSSSASTIRVPPTAMRKRPTLGRWEKIRERLADFPDQSTRIFSPPARCFFAYVLRAFSSLPEIFLKLGHTFRVSKCHY
jgi:hypothetical protein